MKRPAPLLRFEHPEKSNYHHFLSKFVAVFCYRSHFDFHAAVKQLSLGGGGGGGRGGG